MRDVTLADVELFVEKRKGDIREVDITVLPAFDSSSDEDGCIENDTDESDDDNEATIAGWTCL